MKKIYILLLAVSTSVAFSQSIVLSTPTTVTTGLLTPPNTVVNNDTVVYCVSDVLSTFEDGLVLAINNTSSAMDIKVHRYADQYACFNSNQFCWTICYSAATSISPDPITVAPYDTSLAFHGWVSPNGTEGCCFIKYRFYDANNSSVFSEVTIKYCFSSNCASPTLGGEDLANNSLNVYPNPSSDFLMVNTNSLNEVATIAIVDITGKVVLYKSIPAHTSTVSLPLETVVNGVYFCRLMVNNQVIANKKIVVVK